MRFLKRFFSVIALGLTGSFLSIGQVIAASANYCGKQANGFFGFPTWYKYLDPQFVNGKCELNATFPDDFGKIGLAVVEILLRVGGLVAVGFVVYGGFKYITSQGEPDKTKNARQTIVNSIIGLLITTIATVVVAFIGKEFGK